LSGLTSPYRLSPQSAAAGRRRHTRAPPTGPLSRILAGFGGAPRGGGGGFPSKQLVQWMRVSPPFSNPRCYGTWARFWSYFGAILGVEIHLGFLMHVVVSVML
jgi:hypothetical protein